MARELLEGSLWCNWVTLRAIGLTVRQLAATRSTQGFSIEWFGRRRNARKANHSMPAEDPLRIRTLFSDSLRSLLATVGQDTDATTDAATDAISLARRVLQLGGPDGRHVDELRKVTGLQKPEFAALLREIAAFVRFDEKPLSLRKDAEERNARLAMLRTLSWFETMRTHNAMTSAPSAGPARADRIEAFRLVSALELMMRELLRRSHDEEVAVRTWLEQTLPREAAEALKRSPNDPIDGLFLKDLVRLFLEARAWRRLEPLYRPSPLLRLLVEQRSTAESFLDDLRRIRNDVAHFKHLTAVQHALLEHYHDELSAPVREAHARGETSVDPAQFDARSALITQADVRRMEEEALADRRERRLTGRIARAGLALAALSLAALAMLLWPKLRLAMDADIEVMDALQKAPELHGLLAVQACEQGRTSALARLAAAPGAATVFAGKDASNLHAAILRLASRGMAGGAPLTSCVETFAKMGWDANRLGDSLGQLPGLTDGQGPSANGFQRFLKAHEGTLMPGRFAPASELRCPILMLAVWARDVPLVMALRTTGAKTEQPCVLDAFYGDGTHSVLFSSAMEEARRSGDAATLSALQAPVR